jgi:hypothetical protein
LVAKMKEAKVEICIGSSGFDYLQTLSYYENYSGKTYQYILGTIYSDQCGSVRYIADFQGIDVCKVCNDGIDPYHDESEQNGICENCYYRAKCDSCHAGMDGLFVAAESEQNGICEDCYCRDQCDECHAEGWMAFRGIEDGKFKIFCSPCNKMLLDNPLQQSKWCN